MSGGCWQLVLGAVGAVVVEYWKSDDENRCWGGISILEGDIPFGGGVFPPAFSGEDSAGVISGGSCRYDSTSSRTKRARRTFSGAMGQRQFQLPRVVPTDKLF